jgi:hypothetical protein
MKSTNTEVTEVQQRTVPSVLELLCREDRDVTF